MGGLCGDIGLQDFPCGKPGSDTTCAGDGRLHVGKHDQMLVQMEQRWTGICVAGVKIPQTGIAQLDFEAVTDGTEGKPYPKLTWTLVKQKLFGHLQPHYVNPSADAAPGAEFTWPRNEKECKWYMEPPFHVKTKPKDNTASDATSPDNFELEDYISWSSGDQLTEIQEYYNTCFKGKNKDFLVALFYTRLFKRIEDGIKGSEYGEDKPKSKPFEHAKFEYKSEEYEVEWTGGAAWMQVYNNRVRSQFTTTTKAATKSASSGLLEERIGSSFILQPVELPGTIIDLDSFDH